MGNVKRFVRVSVLRVSRITVPVQSNSAIKADAAARSLARDAFHPILRRRAEFRRFTSVIWKINSSPPSTKISSKFTISQSPPEDRRCVGVEALLRWNTPEHGAIPPDAVVSIAEERGLMGVLSKWIANTVLRHQAEWRAKRNMVPVSINVSTVNLTRRICRKFSNK